MDAFYYCTLFKMNNLITATSLVFMVTVLTTTHAHVQRKTDLSRESHYSAMGEHNAKFDHEAFLGKELAAELELHTFDENKKKLVEIIAKIDLDKTGTISETEMYDWIKKVAKKSLTNDAVSRWKAINPDNMDSIDWPTYFTKAYGPEEEIAKDPEYQKKIEVPANIEKNRFKHADINGDGKLNLEEFKAMIHPEDYKHMKEMVIDETLNSIDTDKDGFISSDEFMRDYAQVTRQEYNPKADWFLKEAGNFDRFRDKDHNGKLDRSEISEWIMPSNYDPVDSETKHLFYHSDIDKNHELSMKEILDSQDIFIGSQMTNYGKHLKDDSLSQFNEEL